MPHSKKKHNIKKISKRGTKKLHTKPKCAPSKNLKSYTCYSNKALYKLKDLWNSRHPDNLITAINRRDIWEALKQNMQGICKTELCWLKQKFIKNNLDSELRNYTFAPRQPGSWKKNPHEWLSSVDIENVMQQYEHAYRNFEFLGPSPIDFDTKKLFGDCVWNELCNFDLKRYIKKNTNKIGIIFNTDPHYKSGSHWIAMFIDIKKRFIYYFDSNGDKCPKEILKFKDRIIEQGHQIGIKFEFNQNYPNEHQEGDTECGIYTIYFITELIKENKSPLFFSKNSINDEKIHVYRKVFFNE